MNPEETNEYFLKLHHALRLEIAGAWGTRYTKASKLVRQVTVLTTKNKNKLLAEFEEILKSRGILN